MMPTVPHVTSGLGLRKFQADGFLLTRVYIHNLCLQGNRFQIRYRIVRNKTTYTAQITSGENVFRVMRGREKKKGIQLPLLLPPPIRGNTLNKKKIMKF